jgi:hypothetical protein
LAQSSRSIMASILAADEDLGLGLGCSEGRVAPVVGYSALPAACLRA